MDDFLAKLRTLADEAREIHSSRRRTTLRSIQIVGRLHAWNAAGAFNVSQEKMAEHIGLTPSKYFKSVRIFQMLHRFPEAERLFEAGAVAASTLALVASKITEANSRVMLDGIVGKTRREAEAFLARIDSRGNVGDEHRTIRVNVTMTEEEWEEYQSFRKTRHENSSHALA